MSSRFKILTHPQATEPRDKSVAPQSVEAFIGNAALANAVTQGRALKPMRLNVDLDVETHRKLKIRATEQGVSISELIRGLVLKELAS